MPKQTKVTKERADTYFCVCVLSSDCCFCERFLPVGLDQIPND